jgi:hypothetical protein
MTPGSEPWSADLVKVEECIEFAAKLRRYDRKRRSPATHPHPAVEKAASALLKESHTLYLWYCDVLKNGVHIATKNENDRGRALITLSEPVLARNENIILQLKIRTRMLQFKIILDYPSIFPIASFPILRRIILLASTAYFLRYRLTISDSQENNEPKALFGRDDDPTKVVLPKLIDALRELNSLPVKRKLQGTSISYQTAPDISRKHLPPFSPDLIEYPLLDSFGEGATSTQTKGVKLNAYLLEWIDAIEMHRQVTMAVMDKAKSSFMKKATSPALLTIRWKITEKLLKDHSESIGYSAALRDEYRRFREGRATSSSKSANPAPSSRSSFSSTFPLIGGRASSARSIEHSPISMHQVEDGEWQRDE